MTAVRHASPLLFVSAFGLVACNNPGFASFSDAGQVHFIVDAGADNAEPDAGSPTDGGSAQDAGPADAGSRDGGLLDGGASGDAGTDAGCTPLNIGIFGNPGANASSNFQQWLVMEGTSVTRLQTTTGMPVTAATLQPFDIVILDWLTRDYTSSEASVFSAWVAAGGGVVSMSGYDNNTTDDWHANSLLAPLEVAYSGPLLNGPVTDFATHPITTGLTSVTFNGGYGISDLGGTASTRTPLAFLPLSTGNTTVGFAIQMGSGHAFVWGDEWIEFDSEWSTLPEIKQLWVQVFGWIAPPNRCGLGGVRAVGG
jgi:hypothetical protein